MLGQIVEWAANQENDRMDIRRRPDARIVRRALDEVKAIQTLLADVYKDVGDGRTLVRELVQNADDAGAQRLVFVVLEEGWPEAQNSLLSGPALVVANSGRFPANDHEALHQAIGGSKADDAGKIGRFGIGLKSVFHICEAFVYVGADQGDLRPGALNPWAGTGAGGNADPLHPDWDNVGDDDLQRLRDMATTLLGAFEDGLLLWIPLRLRTHLDRARSDVAYGLGQACPEPDKVAAWFSRSECFALLLAQCGHLLSIEGACAPAPRALTSRRELARVVRPNFQWVGRYDHDADVPDRVFQGRIESGNGAWSVSGADALGLESLRRLRASPDWPTDEQWRDGRSVWIPRKALAHAAITVLRPDDGLVHRCGARLRWAVFLPLDDDSNPRPSAIVEPVGRVEDSGAWDIIMHGYFWPSHDRRSIPGVTDDDGGTGDSAVRIRWNRAVRDELLLPLLPSALANAVQGVTEDAARSLLEAVTDSRTIQEHLANVTRRHVLLPAVTQNGVRWNAHGPDGARVLSIPQWTRAPGAVREHFATQWIEGSNGVIFIDESSPRLGGEIETWSLDWVERLLGCISSEALRSKQNITWTEALLTHLLGSPADSRDSRAAAVARWLAARIGEGVLPPDSTSDEAQAWRRVFATLPSAWLVDAPVATQSALIELANAGAVGAGVLPIPFGRRVPADGVPHPDAARVDAALLELGKRLRHGEGASQRAQLSRLMLAETLLSVRGTVPLSEELSQLPLLRARGLPADREEAWSVTDLRFRAERHRVFARPSGDVDDAALLDAPSDPKRAVMDLANALGEPAWLVESIVSRIVNVPAPAPAALALAVLSGKGIRSEPRHRLELLRRLADPDHANDLTVRRALIALLTGQIPATGDDHKLYYVRRQDSDRATNRQSLEILLRLLGKAWCAVEPELVEPLSQALVEELRVEAVDFGVLHTLLRETLDESTDWSTVERGEASKLLRRLHGTASEERARWRKMPLHRMVGGNRDSFDDRALRAIGALRLPAELESEIRLLEPDVEIADLYFDVPALDDDGILRAMLASRRPYQFADQIGRALRHGNEDRVVLPRDSGLLDLLRGATWLPHRDNNSGLAPRALLLLPRELQESVAPLARRGALGDHRLVEEIAPVVWDTAENVVREILGRPASSRQIQRLATALDASKVAGVEDGAYSLLPDPDRLDVELIDDAINSPLAGSHRGWAVVRAAANALGIDRSPLHEAGAPAQDAVIGIARALCAAVPAARQISALKVLAALRPARDSSAGRVFQSLIEAFTQTSGFFDHVLPQIELPTQDGHWHQPSEIARSASGVTRRHRVPSDLRIPLRLDSDNRVPAMAEAGLRIASSTFETLEKYFESWVGHLPSSAVGAFLGLLGNSHDILRLSQQWLGEDVSVEGMRAALSGGASHDLWKSVRVYVSGRVARGQQVDAVNLLGQHVTMEAGTDNDSVFAIDPVRDHSGIWMINLRDVEPRGRTAPELVALLGGTVEWWAVRALHLDEQAVGSWWSQWGVGSQAQIGPVQASILAHLPLTLQHLNVRERPELNDALRNAQRAQRMREQVPQFREAIDAERLALDHLASLIREDPDHQRFLWTRVQELIGRFGYRADSVLLELAQNADDALSQAAEIAGGPLSPAARRLIVRIAERDEVPTLDVIHYGRPINDTGGAAFPAGRERQWDQDLYFMMLQNLSSKPGETPEQSTAESTTGQFGLGFKSIHLVSETPSVVSGFLAFSIAAGLLPMEQPVPDDPDLWPVDGRCATRVRLPLRADVDASDLIDKMFRRFSYARALLPAFARGIREVIVDGGPYPGVSVFDGEPVHGAPGWSVAEGSVSLAGHDQWRLLRFRPGDAEEGRGTAALVIGLRNSKPQALPSDLPFLWNVTPTSESWGCGYAVNGPFKLDPGRTHVSLDDGATRRVLDGLGEALGKGLVELHDAVMNGGHGALGRLLAAENTADFLASLWTVLASGIESRDDLRQEVFLRLHGPGRGCSAWMTARSVVPSGLPAPFSDRLPALTTDANVETAVGGLDNPGLCHAFAQVDDLASLARNHHVISNEVAQRLRPLLRTAPRQLRPWEILQELAERWDNVLTPERLHALRPLAEDVAWNAISGDPQGVAWNSRLLARSSGGTLVSLRGLLLPRELSSEEAEATVADELRRATFAPDSLVLDPAYIAGSVDLTMFLRLRERHEIDAATMASWYADLSADRRPAALRYLVAGRLQNEVLERLIPPDARPQWLDEYDEVRVMLDELGEDNWRTQGLLAALFPKQFQHASDTVPAVPPLPESARRSFFERLEVWWNDASVRESVIESYEKEAWPDWLRRGGIAASLQSDSQDHWLALLVLGACRSLGRTQATNHRGFVEFVHGKGWWEVLRNPGDTAPWMEMLRVWQDDAVANLKYLQWMSLVPTIYQLSRYLDTYRRLLRSAGRPADLYQVTCLLAPRVDEALTGAGQHFDAPPAPLNMGLHWALRELVRLRVLDGAHLFPDCWVPSDQLLQFLRPFGMDPPDHNASNPEKARAVFDFMTSALNTALPNLHRGFAIPLLHVAANPHLRRQLGLEA
jgi:hypothetical protein